MKPIFIKILCWVLGLGVVGYTGLTIANSIPWTSQLVHSVPVVNSIPTPAIDILAESTMKDSCKSNFKEGVEVNVVRISDAPESEGSYHRWECVAVNPNATEEEYQNYLVELGKYKEWPRAKDYKFEDYFRTECQYYDGLFYRYMYTEKDERSNSFCVNKFSPRYEEDLAQFERTKAYYSNPELIPLYLWEVIDYSKE